MKRMLRNWLEIGRQIGNDERYRTPSVKARRAYVRDQAESLFKQGATSKQLKSQTIERFCALASFVDEYLDIQTDWSSYPIATLEVISRVHQISSVAALEMLKKLKAGDLKFRDALEDEKTARKSGLRTKGKASVPGFTVFRLALRRLWRLKEDELLEVSPADDWRFPVVKSHAVYFASKDRTACMFDERMIAGTKTLFGRQLLEMQRDALAACSLFSVVGVAGDLLPDELLKLCQRSDARPKNLVIIVDGKIVAEEHTLVDRV